MSKKHSEFTNTFARESIKSEIHYYYLAERASYIFCNKLGKTSNLNGPGKGYGCCCFVEACATC